MERIKCWVTLIGEEEIEKAWLLKVKGEKALVLQAYAESAPRWVPLEKIRIDTTEWR